MLMATKRSPRRTSPTPSPYSYSDPRLLLRSPTPNPRPLSSDTRLQVPRFRPSAPTLRLTNALLRPIYYGRLNEQSQSFKEKQYEKGISSSPAAGCRPHCGNFDHNLPSGIFIFRSGPFGSG